MLYPLSYTAQKLLLGRSWVYPVGVLHHHNFIIFQLWLTSHPRSTVVLLDTGTPGTSREIYSEDADGETRTRNPSALAIELYSSISNCWEGVEFIQLMYCINIYLSFLNCDWLLIWEVQWFYRTQELLVPVEKFSVRMPMMGLELATPQIQYKGIVQFLKYPLKCKFDIKTLIKCDFWKVDHPNIFSWKYVPLVVRKPYTRIQQLLLSKTAILQHR